MTMLAEYERATRDAERARLRRVLALRAMLADGMTQTEAAKRLGVSQSAISQQVARERTDGVMPHELLAAGGGVLHGFAAQRGFMDLAAFGSAARGDDRVDSDVDLIVVAPKGTDYLDLLRLQDDLASILGRSVDLITYGGLGPRIDHDILRDKVLL